VGAWITTLGACYSTHNHAEGDNKKVNNRQRDEQGFSLIEISLALLLIGMLISAVLKSAPLIEAVQLRTVVKSVDSYRMATQLFVEKYGHLPGDYPKAGHTLGAHFHNGNGNGRIEGAGLDPHGEAFWFWQHLSAAGLIPHPGTLEPGKDPSFGQGLPKAKIGGGFTVVENPPHHPPMPGLWILLGEQNGVLNNRSSLTPSQARQILDLCGEADPVHGSVRVLEGADASPQSCLHNGHLNLEQQAATCVVYFRV
jgi:prepilin-type N-terminal cleavage/methylation domain-containing protein